MPTQKPNLTPGPAGANERHDVPTTSDVSALAAMNPEKRARRVRSYQRQGVPTDQLIAGIERELRRCDTPFRERRLKEARDHVRLIRLRDITDGGNLAPRQKRDLVREHGNLGDVYDVQPFEVESAYEDLFGVDLRTFNGHERREHVAHALAEGVKYGDPRAVRFMQTVMQDVSLHAEPGPTLWITNAEAARSKRDYEAA